MVKNPVLVADIGGTNARFAIASNDARHFELAQTLECSDFLSVDLAIDTYLHSHKIDRVAALSLAVAGPVVDETVRFPNSHWQIDCESLRQRYSTDNAWLLNDWEAIAYSLVKLGSDDLMTLGNLKSTDPLDDSDFTYGALGPGSGLGVAGLCRNKGILHPLVTEGGHVGFAPESSLQGKILVFLHTKFDARVSRERLLSGPGLVNIYEALCDIHGQDNPGLIAADIAVAGIARTDSTCTQTMDIFFEILGQVAGDVALELGATDGVFIGGGIAQRYPSQLQASRFRTGFENKGRHHDLMQKIPTHLITHKNPGLVGASVYAAERLSELEL